MDKYNENVFPTSQDIYIEINGNRLASVDGYKVNLKKQVRHIKAFGEKNPVGIVRDNDIYEIELSRIYLVENEMEKQELVFDLKDFNLIIVKPDRRIIYTDCNWSEIIENAEIGDIVKEKIKVIARKRLEIV